MKKQKKDKRRQSTQQLMGIQKITDYCISTDTGIWSFTLSVHPTSVFCPRTRSMPESKL